MKILMAHNYYRSSSPCGENHSFEAESALLEKFGHEVVRYTRNSDEIDAFSVKDKLLLTKNAYWSKKSYTEFFELMKHHRPDVVHFQNVHPLISPSAFAACKDAGIPVVQAVRNFRMLCPMGMLLREGSICEQCMNKRFKWPSIVHGCYQDSHAASAVLSGITYLHIQKDVWKKNIDAFICPSQIVPDKFSEAGWNTDSFFVKPNVLEGDPGCVPDVKTHGLFVGRISEEKGISTLLEALSEVGNVPMKIIGYGEGEDALKSWIQEHPSLDVEYLGKTDKAGVLEALQKASFLVFPSIWYETFGRVILEAFACGRPVITSDLGAMKENVIHENNGLLFPPGSAKDLASCISRIWKDDELRQKMGGQARAYFERVLSPEENHRILNEIYNFAIQKNTENRGA